jgi:hypothetical protein
MGYRDLVESHRAVKRANQLIRKLKAAVHDIGTSGFVSVAIRGQQVRSPIERRVLSDSICVWMPRTEGCPFEAIGFLMNVAGTVFHLATQGIFVRGAIVLDRHYADEAVLFGPALIRAYDMERHEAFYPRVLVDSSVCTAFEEAVRLLPAAPGSDDWWRRLLTVRSDARLFLDHLWVSRATEGEGLARHKQCIEENLAREARRPRVWAKYAWLAVYHNVFCAQAHPERTDLTIRAQSIPASTGGLPGAPHA